MEEKRPFGRPSEYYPEICKEIVDYFDRDYTRSFISKVIPTKEGEIIENKEVGSPIPTFEKFCAEKKVSRNTLKTWASKYPDFLTAYETAQELQRAMLISNALTGHYNAAFAKFMATNISDWRDKKEVSMSVTPLENKTNEELILKASELLNERE